MYYTLAQVQKSLAGATGAYTTTDLTRDINQAIESLKGLSGWECLRRTVRFFSAGPVFALPQGYAGLVRVCINGRPSTLRGQDFRFLQSGPGDLRRPPRGFTPIDTRNVLDIGTSPVIVEPVRPFKLVVYTEAEYDSSQVEPEVTITGLNTLGRIVTARLAPVYRPVYSGDVLVSGVEVEDAEPSTEEFVRIDNVVIADGAQNYLTLYAVDMESGERQQIAFYNPRVQVPVFRRYEIDGVPPNAPVEVLAETRIDPMPLVNLTDVIPFQDPLKPIEWMIQADWKMKAGEPVQAQTYITQATNWLKAHEIADDTIQTQFVVNSIYHGSMGEISEEADNI